MGMAAHQTNLSKISKSRGLSLSVSKMSTAKTVLSMTASLAASAMLIRGISNDLLPSELHNYLQSKIQFVSQYFSSQLTIVIEEFQGFSVNQLFEAADLYLGSKTTSSTTSAQRIRVSKSESESSLAIALDRDEEMYDVFKDTTLKWKLIYTQVPPTSEHRNSDKGDYNASLRSEVRHCELSFHRKYKDVVLSLYLPHILEKAKAIKEESNMVKLHTAVYMSWDSNNVVLKHPMTFKTLALDSEIKTTIVEDLENFMNGKEYYERIGKAWKRGYLLYGPPGTGKSSLIAAMANQLKFDIYDLDLSSVQSNSDLRFLLLTMPSRSMLVIEDIDCSVKLQNRESSEEESNNNNGDLQKVTLSGLLNFIDGLWSCCGEGRIIVFSTNHKEKLDPALVRPGRMDMHIHLSYCNTSVFKQLASNYLGIDHHHLFEKIEGLIMEVNVTPAEVAGELMKSKNADVSLQGLVKCLQAKMTEKEKLANSCEKQ